MEEKQVEHVVYEGVLKAKPLYDFEYCRESNVKLMFGDDIEVEKGFTYVDFAIRIENEDGIYNGHGCLHYFYKSDAGDAIAEAVLDSDGGALSGASVDSDGCVVKVEYTIENEDGSTGTDFYLLEDLDLDAEFDLHTGTRSEDCKIDYEEFFSYMNAIELLAYETAGIENLVRIAEKLKIKN